MSGPNKPSSPVPPAVMIRLFTLDDSVPELTHLLHRAYAQLAARGFNYVACDQSDDMTRRRIFGAECYVAVAEGTMIGTITFRLPGSKSAAAPAAPAPAWYRRPDVAKVNQLAVDPAWQRNGIGSLLLDHLERRAAASGAAELALDTAEGAAHLIELYARRGYRFVEHVQWPGLNYRSVILSKRMDDGSRKRPPDRVK